MEAKCEDEAKEVVAGAEDEQSEGWPREEILDSHLIVVPGHCRVR